MSQSAVSPRRIEDHPIRPETLDRNAINVVATLQEAGFEAYLVGGCVRDLLCGSEPKDFDVATNAEPEEIKDLFRRARMVGRRFPIAHVRFGREIIEVSTFRQGLTDAVETNAEGLIVKDRAFGTLAEDAFRRDFTVNALYYDIETNEIIDFVGAMTDIEARRLRFIGEPADRLAEDPVRMLRAIRFAAKLGFELEADLPDHFDDVAERLEAIPSARLFDEFLKMFLSGYGAPVWEILRETPLVRSLFPSCSPDNPLVLAAMRNTDQRIAKELPVTPGFLIAVLLWDDYKARNDQDNPKHTPSVAYDLAMDTLAVQQQHIAIPRRFSSFAREVWQLQPKLEERSPRNVKRLLAHKRFRAAFDFLLLRGQGDDALAKKGKWWEEIQELDGQDQQAMIDNLPKGRGKKRRRRRSGNNTGGGERPLYDNSALDNHIAEPPFRDY